MHTDIYGIALGVVEPWYVESVDFDEGNKCLDIHINFRRGSKFEVDGVMCPVHDTEARKWRHLNFFQHECFLHVRTPRVKTPDGRIMLVLPPFSGKIYGFTLLFEALLIQLCKNMPVRQVAVLTQADPRKLWDMLDLYVAQARDFEDFSDVKVVGMDETSLAKGHEYATLFVDLERRKTMFVTEGKGADTVKEFVRDLKEHNASPEQISDVSCDMSPAFIKGVAENLPNAQITFDKFHILKIINEAVDEVRREEAKTNPLLKGTRYVFLKNDENLTVNQKAQKQELMLADLNLKSMVALRMRESFQQLYNVQTQVDFTRYLRQWVDWVSKSALKPMEKAASMVMRHWDGIVRWKQSQINNGILEGLNSVVQAAKRKARGYKAPHFQTITYLITAKLNLNNINKNLLPT